MVLPEIKAAEIIGKLARPFGPLSVSPESFKVTPSSFKSIPKAGAMVPLAYIEFCEIRLPVLFPPSKTNPAPPLLVIILLLTLELSPTKFIHAPSGPGPQLPPS